MKPHQKKPALSLMLAVLFLPVALCAEDTRSTPFFAFDNGVGEMQWSMEKQASVLKELGYDGISYHHADDLPEKIEAFKKRGLKVFNIYVGVDIDNDESCPTALKQLIAQLKGTGTDLWLFVRGKRSADGKNKTEGDGKAVKLIGEIADLAEGSGIRVALYPHYGFYIATAEQALPVVAALDRENVGLTFNLCHELRAGNGRNFDRIIRDIAPHLFYASINGADHEGDWPQLIQTLDRGKFDNSALLKKLALAGYKGPVGLQCYAIKGDPYENLKRSIKAWKTLSRAPLTETE